MPDTNKHGELSRGSAREEFVYSGKPAPMALAKLLDEWMQGDDTDQRATFEILRRALDEDRPEGYKLFS